MLEYNGFMSPGQPKRPLKFILINIFFAALVSILVFLFLFSPYRVVGDSMQPVLRHGDKVLISNSLLTGEIQRFDIVVIRPPGMKGKKLVKRVVGLPGESIEIRSGELLINNSLIREPFLAESGDVISRSLHVKKLQIPSRSYFLLGDHRDKSTDSRSFGPLERKRILGKTFFRYWPVRRLGLIK